MSEIIIQEKPDTVSYDDLCRLIQTAHQENRKNGIKVNTKITSGAILKEHLGDAVTYVAMCGDKAIGTISVSIKKDTIPYAGVYKICAWSFLAVLPTWTGKGVCSALMRRAEEYAMAEKADALELIVVEKNPARMVYKHFGFESTSYIYRKSSDQFSVKMTKWLIEPPKGACARKALFWIQRMSVRIKHFL